MEGEIAKVKEGQSSFFEATKSIPEAQEDGKPKIRKDFKKI